MMNLATKRELCGKQTTLNGLPAAICGAMGPFAVVVTLPRANKPRLIGEYSWETVQRVLAAGGDFKA